MKILHPSSRYQAAGCGSVLLTWLLAAAVQAHPGHYHPDETDEFDMMRTMFLHPHGALDLVVAVVIVASVVLSCLHGRPVVRFGAMAVAAASLMTLRMF